MRPENIPTGTPGSAGLEPSITCIEKSGKIYETIKKSSSKFDDIVVDTGGHDSEELRTSLLITDILLSPLEPSMPDIETLAFVSGLVDDFQINNPDLKAASVLDKVHPHPKSTFLAAAREAIEEGVENMTLLQTPVYGVNPYKIAISDGTGVIEGTDKKSAESMDDFCQEFVKLITGE